MSGNNSGMSVRQAFQGLIPKDVGVFVGKVTGVDPLEITAVGDDKHIIGAGALCVPKHLTRHTVKVDISDGTVIGSTDSVYTDYSSHSHSVASISQTGATMVVHGELQRDELVYLLFYNAEKKYYVFGRVCE